MISATSLKSLRMLGIMDRDTTCWLLPSYRRGTAPLLFTALSIQFWSTDMTQPIANTCR